MPVVLFEVWWVGSVCSSLSFDNCKSIGKKEARLTQGGYICKEKLFSPSSALAGQGRYKQIEAPPSLNLPATLQDILPYHTAFDFYHQRINKPNLLCQ